jgi:Domain of unknown function (DUF4178)
MAMATISPGQPKRLDESEPAKGVVLLFGGEEWTVTGQADYASEEGYRVDEWCCEGGDTTAYLLREGDPKQGAIRWFFTREIDSAGVSLAGAETFGEWLARNAKAGPPPALTYRGGIYHYSDTTEGMHRDESGKRVRKVTWDYWEAGHTHNLAIERWPDGSFECYLGSYIEPGQVTIRPARRRVGVPSQGNPLLLALFSVPFAYFLPFIMGRPFDEALAFALPIAAAVGWIAVLRKTPLVALAALLTAPLGAAAFWYSPPLTTVSGLTALVVLPAAIAWFAKQRGSAGSRPAVHYAAAFAVGAPLLGVGFYQYFSFAPGPHTPEQLLLALGPAAIGGLAALLISGLLLRMGE